MTMPVDPFPKLPHAVPFLLLDRVIEIGESRGAFVKLGIAADPLVAPDGTLPAPFILEALARGAVRSSAPSEASAARQAISPAWTSSAPTRWCASATRCGSRWRSSARSPARPCSADGPWSATRWPRKGGSRSRCRGRRRTTIPGARDACRPPCPSCPDSTPAPPVRILPGRHVARRPLRPRPDAGPGDGHPRRDADRQCPEGCPDDGPDGQCPPVCPSCPVSSHTAAPGRSPGLASPAVQREPLPVRSAMRPSEPEPADIFHVPKRLLA